MSLSSVWREALEKNPSPEEISSVMSHCVMYHCHAILKSLVVSSLGQLLEAGADSSLQRKRRQSQDFLQPYIAAKLDTLPATFTLGDEKKYNSYYNKPLPGQEQYLFFVLADLMDHESVSGHFVFIRLEPEWHL